MILKEKRLVALNPELDLHIPTYTATIALKDVNLGGEHGQPYEMPIDISAPKPVGFVHHDEGVELLNGQLLNTWANCLHAEQQVFCDLIDISRLDASEVLLLRFWHGDRAWCQHHRQSRYDAQMESWQDVINALFNEEELAQAVTHLLFGRTCLRLRDYRFLCSERVSLATISTYKTQLTAM